MVFEWLLYCFMLTLAWTTPTKRLIVYKTEVVYRQSIRKLTGGLGMLSILVPKV